VQVAGVGLAVAQVARDALLDGAQVAHVT
jgi:hypothetical protein